MPVNPNSLFSVWSPDEVAECLEGVPDAIYSKIWREIVPQYTGKNKSETGDDFENRCLAKFWHEFTHEEQELLNACVAEQSKKLYVNL